MESLSGRNMITNDHTGAAYYSPKLFFNSAPTSLFCFRLFGAPSLLRTDMGAPGYNNSVNILFYVKSKLLLFKALNANQEKYSDPKLN